MNPEGNSNQNTQEKKPEEKIAIKSLRTFQGDVQEAISKNNFSSTQILVSEQKRKLENPDIEKTAKSSEVRNKTFVYLSSIFITLGLLTVGVLYYVKSNEKIEVEQRTKTLIAFSEERKINTSTTNRQEIVTGFLENKNSWNAPVNSVLYTSLHSGNSEIDTEKMLSTVMPNMLPSLIRSFDKYMVGVYSFDTNEPFIILTVKDFALAYSGMLKWEADMFSDIGLMFGEENATTSKTFIDETIKNRDIRALKDNSGNSLVIYSFIDRQTLIIAKDENVLSAIVDKILINKQVK